MTLDVLDPEGDYTLRCGDTEFLVSSKAVSLAAPQLSRASIQRLASETPRTVRIFLNIAHHLSDDVPTVINGDDMLSLANFVDKYKCHSAITAHAQQWLQRDWEGVSGEDLWKALRFAYAMGIEQSYSQIFRQLVTSHAGPFHSWAFAVNNNVSVPGDTLGMCILPLEAKRPRC